MSYHSSKYTGNLEIQKQVYRYGGDEFILLMKDEPNPMPLLLKAKEEFNKHYYRNSSCTCYWLCQI